MHLYIYSGACVCVCVCIISPGGNTSQNNSCIATFQPSQKLSKLDEPDMQDTAREVRTNLKAMYFC